MHYRSGESKIDLSCMACHHSCKFIARATPDANEVKTRQERVMHKFCDTKRSALKRFTEYLRCRIVLEKCECDLVALVKRAWDDQDNKHDALPPMDVVDLGIMLCSALAAAHRGARSLHLDVKPGNVLFKKASYISDTESAAGTTMQRDNPPPMVALLSDFGLSELVPARVSTMLASANTQVTTMAHDVRAGTVGFAPQEQVRGHGRRRSDVYGLGATLVYALTGKRPYPHLKRDTVRVGLYTGVNHELVLSVLADHPR